DLDLYSKGFKYGRLRTADGHYISSEWIKRQNSKARNNYCVQIRRTVDRFANQRNKTPELIKSYIYGIQIDFSTRFMRFHLETTLLKGEKNVSNILILNVKNSATLAVFVALIIPPQFSTLNYLQEKCRSEYPSK
ncbi:hypothetical protein RhiirC2_718044, partial [Rhizophagus irregularis]